MRDILRGIVLTGIFLVPFLPLVVTDSLFFPFITGKNFMFRIVVEIIFSAWVLLALIDKTYRPKFTWILGSFVWLIGIMFIADITGVAPHKSLWSNYERMEGFVALAHLFLYFVVLGSALTTEKLWKAFFNTSIGVACLMSLYAFAQMGGVVQINQSDVRIDARMGNAAYFAIYMLFHVYLALLVAVKSPSRNVRIAYVLLSVMFIFILAKTGTRGTILALGGSAFLASAYIALFEREFFMLRKIAIGMIGVVIAATGAFVAFKDSAYVQNDPILSRLSSISLNEAKTRFTIWSLAIEGVKERPLLGWGQENFNYVFNKHYKASLYAQEPWFDRVHNIVFDWLIAGGILGFLAYASLVFTSVFYATVRPLYAKYRDTFSVTERGLLLGVLAGYIAHNVFVFDNLISYTLFTAIIAMIHARTAISVPAVQEFEVEEPIIKNIAVPTVLVLAIGLIYFVNVPGMQAAGDLIDGFQSPTPEGQYQAFDTALNRGSFGMQEIREQMTRITQTIAQDPNFATRMQEQYARLPAAEQTKKIEEVRNLFLSRTETELANQIKETPEDVRILVFQSSFYRVIGKPLEAQAILEKAIELSPEKQQTHFELGLSLLQQNDINGAFARFKTAYELEPKNEQARMFYAAAAIYVGDLATRDALITPEYRTQYITNDFVLRALYDKKIFPDLIALLNERIVLQPGDTQLRVSLAAVQREAGDVPGAIKTLEQAIVDFPSFKTQGDQYIADLVTGTVPQ